MHVDAAPDGRRRGAGERARGRGDLAPHARRSAARRRRSASRRSRGCARSASTRRRWWFQRDWTDTGRPLHETMRVSYSRLSNLENCELQHVLGDELGLGQRGGYQAWVGKLVHSLIEECENGGRRQDEGAILAAVDARWREQEFPSKAVSEAYRRLVDERMLPNWWRRTARGRRSARGAVRVRRSTGPRSTGVIDRIGAMPTGGTRITDYKTGQARQRTEGRGEPAARHLLPGGAARPTSSQEYRPVRAVELAFVKGDWKRRRDRQARRWRVRERRAGGRTRRDARARSPG